MTTSAATYLITRARETLAAAEAEADPSMRYHCAHMAALRAAAAVIGVKGRPTSRGGPRSVWDVLPRVAPGLAEWATIFASSAHTRAAIEAGQQITQRQADDLLADARAFADVAEPYTRSVS